MPRDYCGGCEEFIKEGVRMTAHMIRLEKSSQGFIGVLLLDSVIFCFTLELDDTFLKQGSYHCERFHGTKWPNTFEIEVPGHTAVFFHAGNTEADTRGCILLGATTGKLKGDRAVLNSGDTFKKFLAVTKNMNNFSLFVNSHIY